MPERQASPGEVDEQRTPGGDGAAAGAATGTGSRTDSPRGDALFSPEPAADGAGSNGATDGERPGAAPRPTPRPRDTTDGPGTSAESAAEPEDATLEAEAQDEQRTVIARIPMPAAPTVRPQAGEDSADARQNEDTQVIPRAARRHDEQRTERIGVYADPPTEQFPRPPVPPPPAAPPAAEEPKDKGGKSRKRPILIVAGVVALLGILYVADLVISTGNVPRGVTVAGLQLGGLSKGEAMTRLEQAIEPRSAQPVQVTAGAVQSRIDPKAAGLQVDYQATVDQAGAQPLNPITRITSFFASREVGVVNKADERSVTTALEQIKPVVDQAPVEGGIKFNGVTPVAVPPVPGQQLDLPAAVKALEQNWASGAPVALPLIPQPTATTDADVQQAIAKIATPAVSGPLTIQGEGATATLQPTDIAAALTFKADAAATPKLVPQLNVGAMQGVVAPQLAKTEKPGRDATLDFSSGAPVVVPSQDGRGIDYPKTLQTVIPVVTGSGPRTITAVYADQPAKLTTDQLNALGITGEISSFTTGGFSADSGQNIKRAAEQINGAIVKPGETFSLNGATNPRDAAHGYVEAGIIENGHAARGIGGGVSQVATTLYNAAYFGGMVDVAHQEHSYYISRYPAAREATVFDDVIDLKFRNDGPTGVLIQTFWTPSNLTIKMFGTKRYEVTSEPGPRTNPTEPQTITLPPGPQCIPSTGAPGFTTTDTRVMRNLQTGEVTRKTRTVKYDPSPTVVCR